MLREACKLCSLPIDGKNNIAAPRIYIPLFSLGVFSHNTILTLNIYAWDDQLVIHIHHVIVRQYKSSTESVSFEHLRVFHRKGKTALKIFGTHPPPLGCDTSGPSFAALYLWLKIIYPQSEFPQSKVLCGESEQWEYITFQSIKATVSTPEKFSRAGRFPKISLLKAEWKCAVCLHLQW
jgi:hypothetical protein